MYEAVTAYPAGSSTAARLASVASRYGYDGLVVWDADRTLEEGGQRIRDHYEIDVAHGTRVRADDPETASGHIGSARSQTTILGLEGGSVTLNRFAAETDRVDVLLRPMAGEGDVNHVIVRTARDNGVAIGVDLRPVIHERGGARVRAIEDLRKLAELIAHYEAPYVVTADPRTHLELRAPRELAALGDAIGQPAAWIERGLEQWGELVERNRAVRQDSFIEPGVKRGEEP